MSTVTCLSRYFTHIAKTNRKVHYLHFPGQLIPCFATTLSITFFASGDTDSYFTIKYTWNDTKLQNLDFSDVENSKQPGLIKQDIYQSPALLKRFYTLSQSNRNSSLPQHRIVNKDGVSVEDKLVLFCQYGNLFRDCDMLEGNLI